MTTPDTSRERAKAERTDALLHAAARLFAARGYAGVSLDDLGTAVGVSGPALYRHFAGKQALLGALLVRVSEDLLDGGTRVKETVVSAPDRLDALIRFHVRFALTRAEVIQVHDRDVPHLSDDDRAEVRRLQRAYIALWTETLTEVRPTSPGDVRLRVQACFGLLNSTPHSATTAEREAENTARTLFTIARAALLA